MKQQVTESMLIRYILEEASESEALEIERWIKASDTNTRQFEQTKFILETSRHLAQASPISETDAWEKFKEIRDTRKEPARIRPMFGSGPWLKIAASIVLVAGLASTAYYFYHQDNTKSEYVTVKTRDKVLTDTLPDGSVIHLNKNASIRYAGNFKLNRDIKLMGEAFFNVAHNSSSPFTVHVNDVDVRDVGTAFNINSSNNRVEIIVESGIVNVTRHTASIELKKQEMINITPGDQQLKKEKNNDLLYNYYRTNEFVANHTPLQRLIDRLNEAYGSDIRIENKALLNTPITGTFPNTSLDKILQVIMLTTPEIHMQRAGNTIILK